MLMHYNNFINLKEKLPKDMMLWQQIGFTNAGN